MTVKLTAEQRALHDCAVALTRKFSTVESARVENLIGIEAQEVHKAFQTKMFTYATDILGMDRDVAYSYIAVARACVKFNSLRARLPDDLQCAWRAAGNLRRARRLHCSGSRGVIYSR